MLIRRRRSRSRSAVDGETDFHALNPRMWVVASLHKTPCYHLAVPEFRAPALSRIAAIFVVVIGRVSTGFAEEVIRRGYGMTRLEGLTKSASMSIAISGLGFASGTPTPT